MKQEIQVTIELSIELDCKYTDAETRAIIERGARSVFRNNYRTFHEIKYAEERDIYSPDLKPGVINWTTILKAKA